MTMKNYVILYFGEFCLLDGATVSKKRKTIFCKILGIYMNKVEAERKIGNFYNKNFKTIEENKGYIGLFSMNDEEKIIKVSPFNIKRPEKILENFYSKYGDIMTFRLTRMKIST